MDSALRAEFVTKLANNYIWNLAWRGGNWKTNANAICSDKRRRSKVWRELVKAGYIMETGSEEGELTSKAFDELTAEPVDLAALYKFDHFDSDKGKVWVSWEQLTPGQRKTVILALREQPESYTLMMAEPRYTPPKVEPFALGGGHAAMEKIGGNGWCFYIADEGLRAKDRAARRELYLQNTRVSGLNWYLHNQKLMEPEEEVPVCEKHPSFFGGLPGIPATPEHWEQGVPATMKEIKDDIIAMRQRLAVLEKFEKVVERLGGWRVFLADYESAVQRYVDELMAKEAAKKS